MKRHYIYKITNLLNGMIYIGKRSCKCQIIDDNYMGSGKILTAALKKWGIENFSKQVLHQCETQKDAFDLQKKIVNNQFIRNKNVYNIAEGGHGGYRGVKTGFQKGRISIIKDDKLKFVSQQEYRVLKNQGWERKNVGSGKVCVYKYEKFKMIPQNKLEHYYKLGWTRGRGSMNKCWVTNGVDNKFVNCCQQNAGYHFGRTQRYNNVTLYKNGVGVLVKIQQIEKYKKQGYKKKKGFNSLKGKTLITNEITDIYVNKDELDKYINNGWRLGRRTNVKTNYRNANLGNKNPMYGKVAICNDLTKQIKMVHLNDGIPAGWHKGRKPKRVVEV